MTFSTLSKFSQCFTSICFEHITHLAKITEDSRVVPSPKGTSTCVDMCQIPRRFVIRCVHRERAASRGIFRARKLPNEAACSIWMRLLFLDRGTKQKREQNKSRYWMARASVAGPRGSLGRDTSALIELFRVANASRRCALCVDAPFEHGD